MTDHPVRLFASAAEVVRVGEGMLARTLPKEEWTHEAHLSTCLWLIEQRPDYACEAELPNAIRAYNESVGGQNTDHGGYHETLTQLYITSVRQFSAACGAHGLLDRVNALLASPVGHRDWPLRFYSRDQLFSVEARRGWVEPDVSPILL